MSLVKSIVRNRSGVVAPPSPPDDFLISESSETITTESGVMVVVESQE